MGRRLYDGDQLAWNLYWDVKTAIEQNASPKTIQRIVVNEMRNACLLYDSPYSHIRWSEKTSRTRRKNKSDKETRETTRVSIKK